MSLTPTLRKAAILINSLDARSADALLDQMGEAQARRVRDAVLELGDIDPIEQERIIAEFLGGEQKPAVIATDDGIELSGSLALALRQPATIAKPAETAKPFAFLNDASNETIARCLLREHPQTIAVVIAHLPPSRAAAIIKQFPQAVRADVLLRVGEMDDMNMDVVREVESGLEAVLAPELRPNKRRGQGAAALQAILQASGEDFAPVGRDTDLAPTPPSFAATPKTFQPALNDVFAPTPAEPRRRVNTVVTKAGPSNTTRAPQLEFAQLCQLEDRAWAKILRAADSQVGLLALAGAPTELVDRLLRQLPPRDAAALQRKIEALGPVRLREIEYAQQMLARIAAQLADQGEIRLPQPRSFATAV